MERNDVMQIRIATEEKQEIAIAAANSGKSVSEWTRETLLAAARRPAREIQIKEPAPRTKTKQPAEESTAPTVRDVFSKLGTLGEKK